MLNPPAPFPHETNPQHMTAASICSDFINSAAQIVEKLINIDTSVTGILSFTIKYQFKTYKIFCIFYLALLQTART